MACLMPQLEVTKDLNGNNTVVSVQKTVTADFIPELWSHEVLEEFKKNLIFRNTLMPDGVIATR